MSRLHCLNLELERELGEDILEQSTNGTFVEAVEIVENHGKREKKRETVSRWLEGRWKEGTAKIFVELTGRQGFNLETGIFLFPNHKEPWQWRSSLTGSHPLLMGKMEAVISILQLTNLRCRQIVLEGPLEISTFGGQSPAYSFRDKKPGLQPREMKFGLRPSFLA